MNKKFFTELEPAEPTVYLEVGPWSPDEQISRIMARSKHHSATITYSLSSLLSAVETLETRIVSGVHPWARAQPAQSEIKFPANIMVVDPLSCLQTLKIVKDARFVVTDSGGLQREAFWMDKKSPIIRDRTEWMEIIRAGAVLPLGTDVEGRIQGYSQMNALLEGFRIDAEAIFSDSRASVMLKYPSMVEIGLRMSTQQGGIRC